LVTLSIENGTNNAPCRTKADNGDFAGKRKTSKEVNFAIGNIGYPSRSRAKC
jgi:hypothetical protein